MPVSYSPWLVALSVALAIQGSYVGLSFAVQVARAAGARRRVAAGRRGDFARARRLDDAFRRHAGRARAVSGRLSRPADAAFVPRLRHRRRGGGACGERRSADLAADRRGGGVHGPRHRRDALHRHADAARLRRDGQFAAAGRWPPSQWRSPRRDWRCGWPSAAPSHSLPFSATALGLAISGMHYTAMTGPVALSADRGRIAAPALSPDLLAVVVAIVAFLVSGGFLLLLVPDRGSERTRDAFGRSAGQPERRRPNRLSPRSARFRRSAAPAARRVARRATFPSSATG